VARCTKALFVLRAGRSSRRASHRSLTLHSCFFSAREWFCPRLRGCSGFWHYNAGTRSYFLSRRLLGTWSLGRSRDARSFSQQRLRPLFHRQFRSRSFVRFFLLLPPLEFIPGIRPPSRPTAVRFSGGCCPLCRFLRLLCSLMRPLTLDDSLYPRSFFFSEAIFV